MNKVVLINSYCDTIEKTELLEKNISLLFDSGFDIVLFTPFFLSNNIHDKVKYTIISKENPYTVYPGKSIQFWNIFDYNGENYIMSHIVPDYGWSSLIQYKNMLDLVMNRSYDNFILMIYDTIIDENLINKIKNTNDTLFFPTKKKDGVIFPVGSQLMIFDTDTIKYFYNSIFKKNYYKNNDVLEVWLEKMVKYMEWNVNDEPVIDGIQITQGIEQNIIKDNSFRFFYSNINKKIVFHYILSSLYVVVETNNFKIEKNINSNTIIDLPEYYDFLIVTINGVVYDITEKVKKINYSTVNKK